MEQASTAVRRKEVRVLDRTFVFEWGTIAPQADGAVLARAGDTVVLVAVVASSEPREGTDFFPLTVEYRERFSAAGRFPGGYRKREGAASSHEILTSRLIDRSIRPLFPDGFRNEVQVMATVLSYDPLDGDPAILCILGASAALTLSGIPWDGPVAAARIGRTGEGARIVNPTVAEREGSTLNLVASVRADGLVMMEMMGQELSETEVNDALALARQKVEGLLQAMEEMRSQGRPRRPFEPLTASRDAVEAVAEVSGAGAREAVAITDKHARREALRSLREEMMREIGERFAQREGDLTAAFEDLVYKTFRESILMRGTRSDGRALTEIRPISGAVALIPRVHGSALFTRGETQALVVCTLGTGRDEQEVEGLGGTTSEAFQLYYRFPPYSVGEVRPLRGPGRREIGHGNLAQKALESVLPDRERFPYTVKVESEITASNGSSSMASVCGGCLALMDAGVPIRRPVAGIAMGLVREGDRVAILSDILGEEDHLGDMDFKVAGTEQGITAVQLDNKIGALPFSLLGDALGQARAGRHAILASMAKILAAVRPQISPTAPRVHLLSIGTHRIRDLIGSGGRTIQALQLDTSTKVDVEDDGTVRVYAQDQGSLDAALKRIRYLTGEPEVGKVYRGTVTGVKEFGVFVKIFEGIEGLVHASELSDGPVRDVAQVASPGDEMVVKILGVDQGKIRLSRRQAGKTALGEIEND